MTKRNRRPEGNPSEGVGSPNTLIIPAKHRILSFTLALCLLLTMTLVLPGPVAVRAADVGIADDQPPDITVNETVIGFAGHQWVVIGDKHNGVATDSANVITLLLEKNDDGFEAVEFRSSSSSNPGDWTGFMGDWYEGSFTEYPNEYNDSTLQRKLDEIASDMQSSTAKEYALIEGVDNQKLWPLSLGEWGSIANSNVRAYSVSWWLGTPEQSFARNAYVGMEDGTYYHDGGVDNAYGVRPAFQLNLDSVIFTSDASGAGKSAANVGDGLVAATASTGAVKLTVKDSGLAITIDSVTATGTSPGDTVTIQYSGVTGNPDRLSAIVRDEHGTVTYYGNLKDNPGASGAATVDLPTGFDADDHTLEVFVEEINGDLYTDFASQPVKLALSDLEPAKLEVTAPTFSPVTLGYSPQPEAQAIVIENTGEIDAVITDVTVDDPSKFAVIPHSDTDPTDPDDGNNGNGNNGGGSSGGGSRSTSRSSGGRSTPDSRVAKTQLPASAFSWDGNRTLTIDHNSITPLGLLSVQWDGQTLTRGTDYSAYSGSVIVRFSEEFIGSQSAGDHTVRVDFPNHTGETTVPVGDAGSTDTAWDNDTHNPDTGGYPDGSYPADNPNTGDGRCIRTALLLSSISAAALALGRKISCLLKQ